MKAPAPSTSQMVEFLAIGFIAAIYLAPAVRAAPYLPGRRLSPPSPTPTAATISHPQPPSTSASSHLGAPSPTATATSTAVLKKRAVYYTTYKSEQKEEKENISRPKNSIEKISSWLRDQKDKLLSQVDKIRGKGKSSAEYPYGGGNQNMKMNMMNPLPPGGDNMIGSGRSGDDYEDKDVPVKKLETAFQHPENATREERFRNVLLLEAPGQVRPGVKLDVDFSMVRSTINGVSGAEYYGYNTGGGYGYGYGYGYSYGSVGAGVFVVVLLWMLVRRRPGMFGSGFPCSRPGWVGSLVGRVRGKGVGGGVGVGGLEGGLVEEVRRGRALLRED